MRRWILACAVILCFSTPWVASAEPSQETDARKIILDAWNYYRGKSSIVVTDMTIHRTSWERSMTIKAWSRGLDDSVFLITEPAKDKGNGTLKKGSEMWTYNPKINRVIKLPPSLMSQSWMGSDFSNNDLAKADSILNDYTHQITGKETHDGLEVYVVKAVAKPQAPVVWGSQILKVRSDKILLYEGFFDEDGVLVKEMAADKIEMLGGRLFPTVWTMRKSESSGEYTSLHYKEAKFDTEVPDRYFSVSFLRSFQDE